MTTNRGWLIGMAVALAAGCGENNDKIIPDAPPDADPLPAKIARGQYIMNVTAACTFCHTPLLPNGQRDNDNLLAGVDCFVDLDSPTFTDNNNGFGCLSTRNLTNHATGLANATDEQIKNAFRNGIRTDNKKLAPIMPYWLFHNMTDDDADAIVAYLRTVPGVNHTVKANEEPWKSTYNDAAELVVPFVPEGDIPLPRGGENNQAAMRGRYLTSVIGLCIDCHTPETAPFSFNLDVKNQAFAGGRIFPKGSLGLIDASYPPVIITRNLTPHANGLGGWSKEQIKKAIAEGRDRDNKQVCAATHGGAISPYAALDPQDLDDIVEYLADLPEEAADTAAMNCGPPPFPLPTATTGAPETICTNPAVDEDLDGVANDGCIESGTDCTTGAGVDNDGDGSVDDGCFFPCGNCQGPTVP